MKTVYFQMLCGASGDMILSSLIDLGVPVEHLTACFSRLGIDGLTVAIDRRSQGGAACAHLTVNCAEQKAWRRLPEILDCIRRGDFTDTVIRTAERALMRLAQAEAAVHGIAVEKVHFHEIGAIDTIVDILGACLCLEYLGAQKIFFSTFTTGHGSISAEHGRMPNPAPATARLIEGFTVATLDIEAEILTPTGAAVLTALGEQVECMPAGRLLRVGCGCGDKQFAGYPNYLRAMLIETSDTACGEEYHDTVCVLETDMDHISGEILGFTAEELMAAGALDVTWTPVFMKKGRPGYRLTVLCNTGDMQRMADAIIANTHTLGVRYRLTDRIIARRETVEGVLDGQPIDQKRCSYKDISFTKAEYEPLSRYARERNIPLIDVMKNAAHGAAA
mgnify:CR=1 FL=1